MTIAAPPVGSAGRLEAMRSMAGGRSRVGVIALFISLMLASAAIAAPAAAWADGTGSDLVIGPIKVHHHFTLSLGVGCGREANTSTGITFLRGNASRALALFDYTVSSHCTLRGSRATVSASAGKLVELSLHVASVGRAVKLPSPPSCKGHEVSRPVKLAGKLILRIHPGVFGTVAVHRIAGALDNTASLRCTEPKGQIPSIDLTATFGSPGSEVTLTASESRSGRREVTVAKTDDISSSLTGSYVLSLHGGAALFSASRSLESAKVSALRGYSRGSLSFAPSSACVSTPKYRFGTLSGTLTVADPAGGAIQLVGSQATFASLTTELGVPALCTPPSP